MFTPEQIVSLRRMEQLGKGIALALADAGYHLRLFKCHCGYVGTRADMSLHQLVWRWDGVYSPDPKSHYMLADK